MTKAASNLVVHAGGQVATMDQVRNVTTPDATETWRPIPHHRLIQETTDVLEAQGMEIIDHAHALAGNHGQRYFGTFEVRAGGLVSANDTDYSIVVGLRNTHDREYAAGLVMGSRVFVCDNLAFSGEVQVARRHTTHILRDLPLLVQSAVGRLGALKVQQDRRLAAYRESEITDSQAHDAVITALDLGVIGVQRIRPVLTEWRTPRHPEHAEGGRTVWRLLNAFTENTKGLAMETQPRRGMAVHGLMDSLAGFVAPVIQDADAELDEALKTEAANA